MTMRIFVAAAAGGVLLAAGWGAETGSVILQAPADPARRVEWPVYGGDPGAQRYSPLEDIGPANVAELAPAWQWQTGEERMKDPTGAWIYPGLFEATPLMLGDLVDDLIFVIGGGIHAGQSSSTIAEAIDLRSAYRAPDPARP
jgi:glucose dehydrogenase